MSVRMSFADFHSQSSRPRTRMSNSHLDGVSFEIRAMLPLTIHLISVMGERQLSSPNQIGVKLLSRHNLEWLH